MLGGEAAAVGIGASVQSDNGTIYIPYRINALLVEPFVNYQRNDQNTDNRGSAEVRRYRVGVGGFLQKSLNENVGLYYGGRIFLTRMDEQYDDGYRSYDRDYRGWGIAPTVGLEYMLSDHVGLAVETAITYESLDYNYDYSEEMDIDDDGGVIDVRTGAAVVLRAYF